MISDARLRAAGLSPTNVLLLGPLIRVAITTCVLALITIQVAVYAQVAHATLTTRQMGDFHVFYRSSQRAAEGLSNPYLTDPADTLHSVNLNPPHVVLALVPLVAFEPYTALRIWTFVSLWSALIALSILFRELHVRVTLTAVIWTTFALVVAAPTGALLYTAQISWLLWGPAMWAWALARRGRWVRSACVLGVLMSIKPFFGLFVPFLMLQRRWKAAATTSITAATCFLVGLVTLGWGPVANWLDAVASVAWADHIFNASLFGVLERLFSIRPSRGMWHLAPLMAAPDLVLPLWILACGVILGFSVYAFRFRPSKDMFEMTRDESDGRADRLFAVALSTGLLISPVSWIYYHFLVVGPFMGLFWNDEGRQSSRWRTLLIVIAVCCFAISPGMAASAQPTGWATASIGSVYFWGLLGLWLYALSARLRFATRDLSIVA